MGESTDREVTTLCPFCDGLGWKNVHVYGKGISGWRQMICVSCRGAGEVTESQQQRMQKGKLMREDRKARGLSLSQEAARIGITPMALSKLEWGRE